MEFACNITCYILNTKCDENIIILNNNKKNCNWSFRLIIFVIISFIIN